MGKGKSTHFQSHGVFTFPRLRGRGAREGTTRAGGGAAGGSWAAGGGRGSGEMCLSPTPWRCRRPLGCCLVGTEGSVCMELLEAGRGVGRRGARCRRPWHRQVGTLGSPDGLLCSRGQLAQLPTWLEQMVGRPVPSPVPAGPSAERPPLRPLGPTAAQRLTRRPPKAPVWAIGPQAGTKQCVPKKGCSWVLAIKWGPGSQKGFGGSEFLSSAPNFKPSPGPGPEAGARAWYREWTEPQSQGERRCWAWRSRPRTLRSLALALALPGLAWSRYSRAPAGLMGEAAPELSLPPAASFSFLPLYWPMKEPSSLNCTSTLPP